MVTKVSLAAILLIAFGGCASAQQAMKCEYERAFGKITNFTNSSGDQLADLCVDRSSGSTNGPILVSGLTLTMDDGVNFTFEDLSGNSGSTMQIAPVIVATHHNSSVQDQSPEINVLAGGDYFVGFIYNELATPSDLAAAFYVHVGGGIAIEGGGVLGFQGEAQFVEGAASISLADNTQYGTTKGTEGTIEIIVADDGTVTGSGSFETQNIRSAGYSPNEWVSMTVTIDELRGFATGPTGQVIKSYAMVTADIVDAEGDASQEAGSFEVFLFDPKIWQ